MLNEKEELLKILQLQVPFGTAAVVVVTVVMVTVVVVTVAMVTAWCHFGRFLVRLYVSNILVFHLSTFGVVVV